MRASTIGVWSVGLWACGGGAPVAPEPEPVEEAPVEEAPEEAAPEPVPEGFPVVAGEALEKLAAGGRLARCPAPEGLEEGAYRVDGGAFVVIHEGWLLLTGNAEKGSADLWVGADPVATIQWKDADRDRWGSCYPDRFPVFEISGKVRDGEGQPVPGVRVGGCMVGHSAVSDEEGRFTLQGQPARGCRLYAGLEDGDALRVAGPVPVRSQGEDVLIEVRLDEVRQGDARDAWFERLPKGSDVRGRSAVAGLELRRRVLEGVTGPAAELAGSWLDQVSERWKAHAEASQEDPDAPRLKRALERLGG